MASYSGIPSAFGASKARHARRKKLEMRTMESVRLIDGLKPEIGVPLAGDGECCSKSRGIGFKELPANESPLTARNELKIDEGSVNLVSEMSQLGSASSAPSYPSSDSGGSSVGMLVVGGEVCNEDEPESLALLSHGCISVIGRRRAMEDAVTVAPGLIGGKFAFFAVYDGHGGSRVANACSDRLHQLLEKEIEGQKSPEKPTGGGEGIDWEEVMTACFAKMDDEVDVGGGGCGVREGTKTSIDTTGSTAAVVVVGTEELVVANCGDSRAVLCSGGVAITLSDDHKPDRPDERERVEAAGGKILNWNGCRVQGVLATSRSIGDHYLKPYVISEPEVTVRNRTESDDFLIIASDGLWDVMSNNLACDVAKKCLDCQIRRRYSEGNCAMMAAAMLAELAMAKGSKDNVSVIVVELKKSNCTVS